MVGVGRHRRQTEATPGGSRRVDPRSAHGIEPGIDGEEHGCSVTHPRCQVGLGQCRDERLHATASCATEEIDVGIREILRPVDRDGLDRESPRRTAPDEGRGVGLVGGGHGGEGEEGGDGQVPGGLGHGVLPRRCFEMRRNAG